MTTEKKGNSCQKKKFYVIKSKSISYMSSCFKKKVFESGKFVRRFRLESCEFKCV